jgi:hypothetical protein
MTFGGPLLIAPLTSMLGIRPGMTVGIHAPPPGFIEALLPLPDGAALVESSKVGIDLQVLFAAKKTTLVEKLGSLTRAMSLVGSIWVCFPTTPESAQVPSEEFVRLAALEMGLTDTKKLMLGPEWTALMLKHKARTPRLEAPSAEA